jgi:hypothetical protein
MKKSVSKRSKPPVAKAPRRRPAGKPTIDEMNQPTNDEFEREGMGIASKE